jgi:signal transduction histidine kinase
MTELMDVPAAGNDGSGPFTALLSVLDRVKAGDFTARMPVGCSGLPGRIADSLNEVIISNQALAAELARVSPVVGTADWLATNRERLWSAQELLAEQDQLRRSNDDLGRRAALLVSRNAEAEQQNHRVQESARRLEKKAAQLAAASNRKSEFIANMSHELRTPLSSLLILAEHLESNPDHNMTATQVEYASVIRASGNDLLTLLNDVLDFAKIESGTVTIELAPSAIGPFSNALLREFEPVTRSKGLGYSLEIAPECPENIVTDPGRLRQILKNLITNAVKFTHHGDIQLRVDMAARGWRTDVDSLTKAAAVVAFSVTDSGIGIEHAQQERIFQEYAQADGTSGRHYGGTGLGLSISHALVRLLGGDITVTSDIDRGSTFTVYLPAGYPPVTTSTTGTRWATQPTSSNCSDSAITHRLAKAAAVPASRTRAALRASRY